MTAAASNAATEDRSRRYDGDTEAFWDEAGDVAVVAFDMGGVLITGALTSPHTEAECWASVAERFGAGEDAVAAARQILWEGWDAVEVGIGSEWHLWDAAARELATTGHTLERFVHSRVVAVDAGVALLHACVDRGVGVALASNFAPVVTMRRNERFSFFEQVDHWAMFYALEVRKPDPAFYERLVAMTGEPPERVAFVDDKIENVEAATCAGLVAFFAPDLGRLAEDRVA